MELLRYFEACLGATYRQVENGGSWATEEHGEERWILFEKSNGMIDWLNNLQFHQVPYREMIPIWQCHGGFLKVWKSVKPYLEPVVRQWAREGKSVRIIGYSHGAALAVLCHEWVWYHFSTLRTSLRGYGFGCPRVLYGCVTAETAQRWKDFYVVRNLDDAVTHLPPRVMGYCHVGNLIEIGEEMKYSSVDAHRAEYYRRELGGVEG